MGCRITGGDVASFYCSTMVAFGPVASQIQLETFEEWLNEDPRSVKDLMEQWVVFQSLGGDDGD